MINYDLLTDFANDHSLAENIVITVSECGTRYIPKYNNEGGKYENAVLLGDIIRGAEHFCYFLERNGYKIVKRKKK